MGVNRVPGLWKDKPAGGSEAPTEVPGAYRLSGARQSALSRAVTGRGTTEDRDTRSHRSCEQHSLPFFRCGSHLPSCPHRCHLLSQVLSAVARWPIRLVGGTFSRSGSTPPSHEQTRTGGPLTGTSVSRSGDSGGQQEQLGTGPQLVFYGDGQYPWRPQSC